MTIALTKTITIKKYFDIDNKSSSSDDKYDNKDKNNSPNKEKKQQQQQYLQQNSHSGDYQDTNIKQIGNTNFKMEAVSTIK